MFILWENGGVQIFRPLDPPVGGVFVPWGPKTDNIISYAINELIFVIVVPILGFLKTTNPLMTFLNWSEVNFITFQRRRNHSNSRMRGPDIEIRHINIPCHVIPLFQGFQVQEVGRSSYMCHQTTHSWDIELPDVLSDILKDFVFFINFVFLHFRHTYHMMQ